MNSKIIIIAILIFVKVIGITGQAKAEFVYDENYLKNYKENKNNLWEERQWDLENTRLDRQLEWEKEWGVDCIILPMDLCR